MYPRHFALAAGMGKMHWRWWLWRNFRRTPSSARLNNPLTICETITTPLTIDNPGRLSFLGEGRMFKPFLSISLSYKLQ